MTIKIGHSKASKYVAPEAMYTGLQPSSVSGEASRATFQNQMNWRQWGQVANYWGRPDPTKNGNYASDFYIVCPGNTPADAGQYSRKICIECQCWDYTDAGATTEFKYNGTTRSSVTRTAAQTQGYEEEATGLYYQRIEETEQDQQSGGYLMNKFEVDGSLVAGLGVYSMPEYTLTTDAAYRLNGGNFGSGTYLKGDLNNSVGTLVQYQNSSSASAAESLVANTRLCLGQWCTPSGVYCIGAGGSLAWTDLFDGYTFKVRPRNLRGRNYATDGEIVEVDCAVVAVMDADTAIRFTSSTTGDTYTKTFTSTSTTPTLYLGITQLQVAPEGDEIEVEVYTSTTKAIEVKTVAMFESGYGLTGI